MLHRRTRSLLWGNWRPHDRIQNTHWTGDKWQPQSSSLVASPEIGASGDRERIYISGEYIAYFHEKSTEIWQKTTRKKKKYMDPGRDGPGISARQTTTFSFEFPKWGDFVSVCILILFHWEIGDTGIPPPPSRDSAFLLCFQKTHKNICVTEIIWNTLPIQNPFSLYTLGFELFAKISPVPFSFWKVSVIHGWPWNVVFVAD